MTSEKMLLGSRVVRGPDWKTRPNNKSESVEVGFIGTIINLHHFQDGTPLPEETVLVHWDTGEQLCCRAGQNGYYDLRILDSAPAGVKFKGFCCDSCQQIDIAGMRWQCADCPNYVVFCTSCYMNDMHYMDHRFVRFDTPSDKYNGIEVGERSTSFKIQSRGILPGAKVRTKKGLECSWTSPVLIGGDVLDITTWDHIPRSTVLVKWGEVGEQICRLGYEGEVDLELMEHEFAYGPYFYPNHLPMVSVGAHLRLISKIVSCEKISRKEIIDEGENAINYLDELLSTCDHESKAMLCRIKREIQEQQHEIDTSENIQKLVSVLSKQENEQADFYSPHCDDTKEYQSMSTSTVALETNSFQDTVPFAVTDTVDGGSVNKSRVANLASKFSTDGGQKEGPLLGNEQNEVSEVQHNVSWMIHKFERMTSSSMSNLHNFLQLEPVVPNKFPTALSQDKKQDNDDASPSAKEKSKEEETYSKPYLPKSSDQKSMQHAPCDAEKQDTFNGTTPPEGKVEIMKSKFETKDKDIHADKASPINLTTSSRKPILPNSGKRSMHRGPSRYATNCKKAPTVSSEAKKQGSNDDASPSAMEKGENEETYSKPYLSKSGDQKSMQHTPCDVEKQDMFNGTTTSEGKVEIMKSKFETKDKDIYADVASPICLTASSRKPILPNSGKRSMHRGPSRYATNCKKVPTVSSEAKKQDNFDATTTLCKVKPKEENSELEAKSGDICAHAKYVSHLVRRFEDLAK